MIRVAINGFGRIGRMVLRAGMDDPAIEFVAINDLTDPQTLMMLLKYDSVHGRFQGTVRATKDTLIVNDKRIKVYKERNPAQLPWKKLGVDVVIESTGLFTYYEKAKLHLDAGASRVLLSAPGKGDIPIKTIVYGVNHRILSKKDLIVSNASCTTNCLAPMVSTLHEALGIKQGFMTTVHAFTGDQRLVDAPHKDMRRARCAPCNVVPTTTGAALAVGKVIPELNGKLDGMAIRVPVPDGSITDFVCMVSKKTTVEEVNKLFQQASKRKLKGILEYSDEPLVSSDIIGNPHSVIFDSLSTKVNSRMVKVVGWYDNEWGYSNRMIDLIKKLR